MPSSFENPNHRASEELAFEALLQARKGNLIDARAKYLEAGEKELLAADQETNPKTKTIFAISSVSCFLKSLSWVNAENVARAFLNQPELLDPDGIPELQCLLDCARNRTELEAW